MKTKNKQTLPILACALAFALWGFNTPFVKISLEAVPLFSLLFLKFAIGAVVFMWLARKSWKPMKRQVRRRIIIATLSGYVLSSCLMYKGIELTGGLNASLLYLIAPLVLYFASVRFLKEKYDSRLLVGVIAGFAGALLIIGAPLLMTQGQVNGSLMGNMLVLIAVITDVSGTILIKPVFKKVSVLQMTGIRFTVATIALIPFALTEVPDLLRINSISTEGMFAISYNIIFATLIAFYLYHWGLKRISGEQLSPLHYIDPIFGSVGSILILGERPTTLTITGIILVICGLYFSEAHKLKMRHHIGHHR